MFALVENEFDFDLLCNSTEKARKQKTRKERNKTGKGKDSVLLKVWLTVHFKKNNVFCYKS